MDNENFTLITGGSSGIGEACAKSLAQKKKNLILIARRKEKLDQLKANLESEYEIEVQTFKVDLNNLEEIENFFKKIKNLKIDTLINNAGLALGKASFEDYDWEDFNQMIDVNIRAFTRVAQLAIPQLKATKGHIVNVSSVAGIEGYEGGSVYCASKAFVKMISKTLRIDLHGTGVRVTDIAPGAVDTEFSEVRFKGDQKKAKSVYENYTPLYAQDIANSIVFALSQPKSVNIEYLLIMPTAQASATRVYKS